MKKKLIKVFSILAVFIVILTMTLIPAFAATYNPIVPIDFNNYGSYLSAVAFPGAHSLELYVDGATVRDYLDNSDYNNTEATRIKYGDLLGSGSQAPYIQIYLATNYSSIYFNSVLYNGSTTNNESGFSEALVGVTSISSYPVANSFNADTTYHYTFNIVLGNYVDYDAAYMDGYDAGFSFGYVDGLDDGKEQGYQTGYNEGYDKGVNATESEALGHNLLGATLNAPINALNQFVLIELGETDITLGYVVGAVIGLCLLLAFLKMFAGG